MIWISVGIIVTQIIIAVFSYFKLYRHRAVYSLSTAVLRMPHGSRDDVLAFETKHIDDKLKSGKYTVLQILERQADKDLEIILGQIKK